MAPAPPALGAVVVHAANSTDMKLQLDGRTFASTSTSTLLTLSPSSFGTCNHVLWASQAGAPFHMFSREALPLGNFAQPLQWGSLSFSDSADPYNYCYSGQPFTPALRPKPALRLAYAPGCFCPTLHLYRLDSLEFAALVPVPAAAMTPALSGLGPTSAQDG